MIEGYFYERVRIGRTRGLMDLIVGVRGRVEIVHQSQINAVDIVSP